MPASRNRVSITDIRLAPLRSSESIPNPMRPHNWTAREGSADSIGIVQRAPSQTDQFSDDHGARSRSVATCRRRMARRQFQEPSRTIFFSSVRVLIR